VREALPERAVVGAGAAMSEDLTTRHAQRSGRKGFLPAADAASADSV
jgi:hypothetical protein